MEKSRATECTRPETLFSFNKREIVAAFDGGLVTSDAGVVLLSQLDRKTGVISRLGESIRDGRQGGKVRHRVEDLVRQRVFQIACGYEDASDANTLRRDLAFEVAVNPTGAAGDLASQPTLSRLEAGADSKDVFRMSAAILEMYIDWLRRKGPSGWKEIVLDIDSTDDPTHGGQQLSLFHGFYDQWMYHPLLVFDSRGFPIAAVLRPGTAPDAAGVLAVVSRVLERIWEEFPDANVTVRADGGFASPEAYEFYEAAKIGYVIGQGYNSVHLSKAEPLLKRAEREFKRTGEKARVFGTFRHQAKTWMRKRKIVVKAEVLANGGRNPRFVISNLPMSPEAIYATYTGRGLMENFIKDLKNALSADRLSCHRFLANQFRLLLHVTAYVLMFLLREHLAGTVLANKQFDTLRLRILKLGARIRTSVRRIWLHLASGHPEQGLWLHLARRLGRPLPA